MARKGHGDEYHFWSKKDGIWKKHVVVREDARGHLTLRVRMNVPDAKWRAGDVKETAKGWSRADIRRYFLEGLRPDGSRAFDTPTKSGAVWKAGPPKRGESAPSIRTIMDWEHSPSEANEATDGCIVEPDGTCEHGFRSWQLVLGYI